MRGMGNQGPAIITFLVSICRSGKGLFRTWQNFCPSPYSKPYVMKEITPFRIDVQQNILDDLQLRLINTHWPEEIKDRDWNYGTDLSYMKELLRYWKENYEWRAQEDQLNQFNHYRVVIDGYGLHFINHR